MPRRSWKTRFSFQPAIDELESRQLLTATIFQGALAEVVAARGAVDVDGRDVAAAAQCLTAGHHQAATEIDLAQAETFSDVSLQVDTSASQQDWGRDSNPGLDRRSDQAGDVQDYVADQTFAVAENSDAGTFVGLVATSFPNASTDVAYSLVDGNQAGLFEIDTATGVITTADGANLDFESQSSYSLTVQVGNQALSDTALVTINLTDVNEAPVVTNQSFDVAENSAPGTVVGTVSASDEDAGAVLTYAITDGNDQSLFVIDASTGAISVAEGAVLDYEASAQHELTISVSDGQLGATATATVHVADVNEAPTISDAAFALEENSPGGTPVGTVSAADPDQGAVLTYAITSGNDAGQFAIDPQTGAITVADGAALNFESTASYELTVQVSDGLLAAQAAVTIDLIDVAEGTSLPSADNALRLATDVSVTFAMEATTFTLSDEWTTFQLTNTYVSPVIVGTILQQGSASPAVVRIRNVEGSSFEARLQNPSGDPVGSRDVFFTVVEEGSWTLPDGRNIEAHLVSSDGVNHKTNWSAYQMERLTLDQTYVNPVVLGQVMSTNDEGWSAFFSSDGHTGSPAEPGLVYVGKHVGEDVDITRAPETLGVIVVEAGSGQIDGVNYSFNVGPDTVVGVDDGATSYPVGLTDPEIVVAVQAGMDGGDGGWAVVTSNSDSVFMAIQEDQIGDLERNHITEYVGYAAFQSSFNYRAPLNTGEMQGEVLQQASVEDAAEAVISRFVDAGLSDTLAAELGSYQFVVMDLSPLGADVLSVTEGNVIYLDDDAGGYGWFVDQTPQDSSEFVATADGLYALEDSVAYETVDLMTVLASEFGDQLGVDAFHDPADTLSRELYLSERRDDYVNAVDELLSDM